jgi:dihydroorotate dehydrogenase electron transfer subunit
MALQTHGMVVKNERIKSLYFLLEIYCPPVAHQIKPGQFIMLKVSNQNSPLLRRPFSVHKSYPAHHPDKAKRGRFTLLYKKVGKGTQKMTGFKKGQEVDMIGPLGNGFTLPVPPSSKIILIGGRSGYCFPLPFSGSIER